MINVLIRIQPYDLTYLNNWLELEIVYQIVIGRV